MQPIPNRPAERIVLRIDPAKKEAFLQMLQLFDFVEVETLEKQVSRYVQNAPKDVPLTDDDIMQEVLAARKGKKGHERSL